MVKCADCGYLAQRVWKHDLPVGFLEIDEEPRQSGWLAGVVYAGYHSDSDAGASGDRGDRLPTCFARAVNLHETCLHRRDARVGKQGDPLPIDITQVLNQERSCSGFTEWQRGFTPKEHREMMDRERMLKWQAERDEASTKRDDDFKRWQMEFSAKQAQTEKDWRERQEQSAKRRHRWDIFWFVLVASLLVSAATIVGAYIQRGGKPKIEVHYETPATPSIPETSGSPTQ